MHTPWLPLGGLGAQIRGTEAQASQMTEFLTHN